MSALEDNFSEHANHPEGYATNMPTHIFPPAMEKLEQSELLTANTVKNIRQWEQNLMDKTIACSKNIANSYFENGRGMAKYFSNTLDDTVECFAVHVKNIDSSAGAQEAHASEYIVEQGKCMITYADEQTQRLANDVVSRGQQLADRLTEQSQKLRNDIVAYGQALAEDIILRVHSASEFPDMGQKNLTE